MNNKIKIGISACVAGHPVRYDKSHKRSYFCMEELADFAEFKPVCPEMAIGLPAPRATIRQISRDDVITVSRPDGSGDVTEALTQFGLSHASQCEELAGFIFCSKSPSCGMERVKVYQEDGKGSEMTGVGLFAKQIMEQNPLLPCEENGRLNDAIIKENFVTRVFTYQKWLELKKSGLTRHTLIQFHSAHKYLVMSHHVESYKRLGRLLGNPEEDVEALADKYIMQLMSALKVKASRKSHTNTLYHLQGYFKKQLTKEQRSELTDSIHSYREGHTPLLVPLTLINHYLRDFPNEYLNGQTYLEPHPKTLRLRYGY
jgi:uncharacterized protein YbgA (DUF1722 family)/uncharacterized protein YbbK (DUF523 family)